MLSTHSIVQQFQDKANLDFDTAIKVAGLTVSPNQLVGGGEPAETVVTISTREELLTFTPAEARALAAALQAVAVYIEEEGQS